MDRSMMMMMMMMFPFPLLPCFTSLCYCRTTGQPLLTLQSQSRINMHPMYFLLRSHGHGHGILRGCRKSSPERLQLYKVIVVVCSYELVVQTQEHQGCRRSYLSFFAAVHMSSGR
ncbi:hypothetical protein SAICODRAFT_224620 [Saitoella complicata NRRL Y-17804]|uniref:uncharacterized protein n=1 Tax=Saitoella complicata (strain BCRC 22490 / CBS 7301 / JCM 7358 / NBRC 10748 / NRRL Y-17804) TaxID=698492 RepID=UPI0008672E51|nr:uncharacterized protein SAICODRAFT_224620 [Saitoella complicata NRRL Y-17804]ODQ53773.1 hypothetical protein SAICODRAFT_224620 [Saitoella complicata NRRL Y-17804]